MHPYADNMIPLILFVMSLAYAVYAGFESWSPWYTVVTSVGLGLIAGASWVLWVPDPQGALGMPLAGLLTGGLVSALRDKHPVDRKRVGRVSALFVIAATVLFCLNCLVAALIDHG